MFIDDSIFCLDSSSLFLFEVHVVKGSGYYSRSNAFFHLHWVFTDVYCFSFLYLLPKSEIRIRNYLYLLSFEGMASLSLSFMILVLIHRVSTLDCSLLVYCWQFLRLFLKGSEIFQIYLWYFGLRVIQDVIDHQQKFLFVSRSHFLLIRSISVFTVGKANVSIFERGRIGGLWLWRLFFDLFHGFCGVFQV